ncbi:MAG TPA: hypothetical protein VHS33_00780 [Sphingomicrobium sp.]|jgi:hypothetical protein|nr:hypothetical protein [Sphingomicrobium sp.]
MRILCSAALAALFIGTSANAAPTNYPAQQSTITYSTTSGVTSGFRNYARATSTVIYDPSTDTYTIRDTGSLTTKSSFGPSDIASNSGNFTLYSKTGGAETFRLLDKASVGLTYVDYGEWLRSSAASGTTSVNDTYLVFGSKTPGASVPTTGSGSYSTIYDGSFADKNGGHALNGTGSMTANFGTGVLSYSAAINGVPSGPLAFSGSGSINFKTVAFSTTTSSSGYSFSQTGNFYGPSATEVGGLFRLWNMTGAGQGAFVGH